ncbi:MAG: DNA repair protein RecO [Bacteroidota bacterium]|nr:DNA repair protein RecO [Bacteroidota bacterium]MEE3226930.1 DNA repair protein RecO [Bacteroidota bacterium]
MLVTTKAIVISAIKYGEADLIVRCFTEEAGLKSYILRRILKSKKGKLRTAMFQPASQLELVAVHKDKGTLESIREAKVIQPYLSLHTDVLKSSVVLFLSEMLRNAIQEEEENRALYAFLEHAFLWFDLHEQTANFHLLFLLELTKYLGFYPDTSELHHPHFNLETGIFEPVESFYSISEENLHTLKQLLGINFDALATVKLNQKRRADFVNMLLAYYELHLHGFKKPKSLAVLTALFN